MAAGHHHAGIHREKESCVATGSSYSHSNVILNKRLLLQMVCPVMSSGTNRAGGHAAYCAVLGAAQCPLGESFLSPWMAQLPPTH